MGSNTTAGFDPLAFHERAVRTASHEDPGEMRDLLADTLREHGADARVDEAGNTIAVSGSGSPHYVLNTHVDTVPPHVPFRRLASPPEGGPETDAEPDAEPAGDVVAGRGACDAKGPLAALVDAFLAVEPAAGRVTLAVTPDEEVDSSGADHLVRAGALAPDGDAPPIDGVLVGEPTELDACIAARGRFEGTVALEGTAAHAAEPESGASAVRALAPVLEALDAFDDEHGPGVHETLGGPTLTATTVSGGEATNQVPAACRLSVDRRSVPPESADGFERSLDAFLRERVAASGIEGADVSVALIDRPTPFLEAWATDADAPVVEAIRAAGAGDPRPFTAATEASYFAARAPTVVFGPGALADDRGAVAHADREYVRRSDVREAAHVLRGTLSTLVE